MSCPLGGAVGFRRSAIDQPVYSDAAAVVWVGPGEVGVGDRCEPIADPAADPGKVVGSCRPRLRASAAVDDWYTG